MRRAFFGSIAILILLVLVISSFASAATVTVIQDESTFSLLTGATSIVIPGTGTLPLHPWAYNDYSCEVGSTGISLASGFINVKTAANWICIIGPGWNAPPGNTVPPPEGPTIVANGEDDFEVTISFVTPVSGVGFTLLTNSTASETITLYFADSTQQVFNDSQLGTGTNAFEFVGFKSSSAITKVLINTTGGAVQNEGIAGIWVIENSPPTASAGGPYTGDVGVPKGLSGTASDPDSDPLTYSWSVNSPNCQFINSDTLNPSITCQLIGTYTLTLTVSDGFYTVTKTASLTITDSLLTTSCANGTDDDYERYSFVETKFVSSLGTPVESTASLDPGFKYKIEASGVFYAGGVNDYDIRADAEYSQDLYQRNHGETWTDLVHNYETSETGLLDLKVDDEFVYWGAFTDTHRYSIDKIGTGSPVTLQFQIYDTYPSNNTGGLCVSIYKFNNTAPVAYPGGPYQGLPNAEISLDGSASSDSDGDPLTYAWDFGDGQTGTGVTPSHTYTAADTYDVCLTVNDGFVDSTEVCTTAVINTTPTADPGGPYLGLVNTEISFDGSGSSDPDGDSLTFAWIFGDGGTSTDSSPKHTYTSAGLFDVCLIVNDGFVDSTQVCTTAVINTTPTADPGGPYLGAVNTAIPFDGSYSSDPDGDSLSYAWTFGDSGTGTGDKPSHTYTSVGIFDVCLTVNDGYASSDNICTIAVVYDPAGGFVTGGGWINSPLGAYAADLTLSGKASFGFVAKYKKGANVPDGNTEFQFKAGDFNFHSTSYQWLVVAGNKAQFKGEGTINGQGTYKFMIWADDDSPDTFHIKIWEGENEDTPIYDSDVQNLGGGSIVVHK
jgi:PKD repeat protein